MDYHPVAVDASRANVHRAPGARLRPGRVIADPNEVVRRAPDIIIGSWCGKRFRPEQVPEQVKARPGGEAIPAVRDGELHEIKSADILQPGAAALTDGLKQLHGIVALWVARPA